MKDELDVSFKAIETFQFEGRLPTDPEYLASQSADKELDVILHSAACFVSTSDVDSKKVAEERANKGITAWINLYAVTGNPINEGRLIRLLQSIDLMKGHLSTSLSEQVNIFARQIIQKGDSFFSNLSPLPLNSSDENMVDSRNWNNWQTWRLALRATSSALLNDEAEFARTREIIAKVFPKNLPADAPSFDFIHRDSLHYHLYNLQAWLIIAWYTTNLLGSGEMKRIETAFQFMKPFYLREKQHIEFTNSKIPFDIRRSQAGIPEYQNKPWEPARADQTFRLARCLFANLQSWTTHLYRNNSESPSVKFLAALDCEAE